MLHELKRAIVIRVTNTRWFKRQKTKSRNAKIKRTLISILTLGFVRV